MAKILRGEIRWTDLKSTIGREQSGERPVLILSQDIFNERSGTVIAMALTSQEQKAGFPLTHEVLASKLPKRSWVKISQIRIMARILSGTSRPHSFIPRPRTLARKNCC